METFKSDLWCTGHKIFNLFFHLKVVAGTNWFFTIVSSSSCDNFTASSVTSSDCCNEVKVFVPLPQKGDPEVDCITKGMEISCVRTVKDCKFSN